MGLESYLNAAHEADSARAKKYTIETLADKIVGGLDKASSALSGVHDPLELGQRLDRESLLKILQLHNRISGQINAFLEANAQPPAADGKVEIRVHASQPLPINKEEEPRAPRAEARRQPRGEPAEPAKTEPAQAETKEPAMAPYPPAPVPEREVVIPIEPFIEPVDNLPVLAVAAGADARGEPGQHGVCGIRFTKPFGYVSHNLDDPTAWAAFGAPGAGKSYFVYGKLESHLRKVRGVNGSLQQAACGLIPRIGAGPDIALEFLESVWPNRDGTEIDGLRVFYQAEPAACADQAIWCLPEDVAAYRARYPFAMVLPLQFDLKHLSMGSFTRALGAQGGKHPLYLRELMRGLRALKITESPTLGKLRDVIKGMNVPDQTRKLASARLDLIEPFVRDGVDPRAVLVRPGRAISVAISTDTVTPEDGMLLGTLALDTLALRSDNKDCPLVILFDECHEHFASPEMTGLIVHLVKRRRHIGTSTLFSTHDPRCFRSGVIGILDGVAQFATDDKEGLKELAKELSVFEHLSPEDVAALKPGRAWLWARSYFNYFYDQRDHLDGNHIYQLLVRPRFAHHGGATKTAVK